MEKFGFEARHESVWTDDGDELVSDDTWVVWLPHQCDAWCIAGEAYDGVPHAEAVERLEQFIAEAQDTLTALRERREFGTDN